MTAGVETPSAIPTTWRPPARIQSRPLRWALWLGALAYLWWALGSVEINPGRIEEGLGRAAEVFAGVASPDFITRWADMREGLVESLVMTVVATFLGVLLSIPLGLGAAKNLAPRPLYLLCRSLLATSRAFHEIILAIVFVAMFGFGPFAGLVTLMVSTVGFLGKLLAEDLEAMAPGPLEAVRATGASWWQQVDYAVVPRVMPRFVGLTMYRLDINFRESAIVGIIGAGGIGATLKTAFDRYEYDTVAAILIVIILTVLATETLAARLRKRIL